MSTLPVGSPSHVQPASPPAPAEHFMAKPAPNQPTSSITSMQASTVTVTPEALVLAMQIMSLSNPSPAAQGQQVITLPDGSTYVGETQNGKPHGRGVLQYSPTNKSQRQRYEGEFANGLPDGEGYMTWLTGAKYIGGWKNGQMHGRGNYCLISEVHKQIFEYTLYFLTFILGGVNVEKSHVFKLHR